MLPLLGVDYFSPFNIPICAEFRRAELSFADAELERAFACHNSVIYRILPQKEASRSRKCPEGDTVERVEFHNHNIALSA